VNRNPYGTIYSFGSAGGASFRSSFDPQQQHFPLKDWNSSRIPIIVSAQAAQETFHQANTITRTARTILHQHLFTIPSFLGQ